VSRPLERCACAYEKPATQWIDALPIGNGRLGAMVFGGGKDGAFNEEILQFNEDTLWSGQPRDGNNRDAKNHLVAIRAAVLEQQDYHLADQLRRKMQGLFAESYQPLGNLRLDLTHSSPSKNFRRQLDLDTASVTVSYEVEGVQFQREAFVFAPDQVLVLRVTASKLHQISGVLTLDGPLQKTVKALTDNRLLLTGKAAAHIAGAPRAQRKARHPLGRVQRVFRRHCRGSREGRHHNSRHIEVHWIAEHKGAD
jgi:alpha-L-fucosidase 2